MFLPYERQITELLQELMHFRAVAVRSQQEKARYAEELNETCQEIEQALYEMGKRQTIVLRQWETISDGDRSRILSPGVHCGNPLSKEPEMAQPDQKQDD